ncbi:hypothetical protein ACFLSJ_07485 [Verrucomicrobiota bacterium]
MTWQAKNPMVCPHCGKPIRKAKIPRDGALLLHALTYRVPIQEQITEKWIETARKHCKMKPERLAELRGKPYARYWTYMEDKRKRRQEWLKETGEVPPAGWTPPRPDEPDHTNAVAAMKAYRKSVAKLKAKQRRNPDAQMDKLVNRYLSTKRYKSSSSKFAALDDIEARLILQWRIQSGDLTMDEFYTLQESMLPEDHYSRRAKKRKDKGMGFEAGGNKPSAREETRTGASDPGAGPAAK